MRTHHRRRGQLAGAGIAVGVLVLALAWSNRDRTKPEDHGPEQWAKWEAAGRRSVDLITPEDVRRACRDGLTFWCRVQGGNSGSR